MEISPKRKVTDRQARSKNFTDEETLLLAELVVKRKHILESKKSGQVTHKQKEKAWLELSAEFNVLTTNNIHRSAEMLKMKWRNTKKTSTKNYGKMKTSFKKTGGGHGGTFAADTPIDALVHDVIGERMTGLLSTCDSDTIISTCEDLASKSPLEHEPETYNCKTNFDQPAASTSNCQTAIAEVINVAGADNYENTMEEAGHAPDASFTLFIDDNWGDYTPELLKKTPSKPLQIQTKEPK